jgi:hypothetical protein
VEPINPFNGHVKEKKRYGNGNMATPEVGCGMHKGLKQTLEYLGPDYTMKVIDLEECAYRDLGEYDIEISGCRKKRYRVYVWQKKPLKIVYASEVIRTLPALKAELDRLVEHYAGGRD